MAPRVTDLWVYPVKSCRGIALAEAQVAVHGIAYDRQWMIVGSDGRMRTQRDTPALATIATTLAHDALVLHAPHMPECRIPLARNAALGDDVVVWEDTVRATDEGDIVAAWVAEIVRASVRLVRMVRDHVRHARSGTSIVAFHDGYPFLVVGAASLRELNQRIIDRGGVPVPMQRFRPNIVVAGCEAHAEDAWGKLSVSGVELVGATRCARCAVTTLDQETGVRDALGEPLRTLATYRKIGDGVEFGRNFGHVSTGTIRVGDTVKVLATIEE